MGKMKNLDIDRQNGKGVTTGTRNKSQARAKQAKIGGSDAAKRQQKGRAAAKAHAKPHGKGKPANPPAKVKSPVKAKVAAKTAAIKSGRVAKTLGSKGSSGAAKNSIGAGTKSGAAPASHAVSKARAKVGGRVPAAEQKAKVDRTKRQLKANTKTQRPINTPAKPKPKVPNSTDRLKGTARKIARKVGGRALGVAGAAVTVASDHKKAQQRANRRAAGIKDA